jgi:hypothetical protein
MQFRVAVRLGSRRVSDAFGFKVNLYSQTVCSDQQGFDFGNEPEALYEYSCYDYCP